MSIKIIPLQRFEDVYARLGWKKNESRSSGYLTWTHPQNNDVWVVLPRDENSAEYRYLESKNLKAILYSLDMKDSPTNLEEIRGQLTEYNYKLYNRFQNTDEFSEDYVPFEIAQQVPSKNISAFRAFFTKKVKGQKTLPIENFSLSHTQPGSFIIPISIKADLTDNTLFPLASETLSILEEYLESAFNLLEIPISNPEKYAKEVIEKGIDSRMVKDFLADSDSIAKVHDKYSAEVRELSIYSKYNPILDLKNNKKSQIIREVEINKSYPVGYEHILSIENLEEKLDDSSFYYNDVVIEAVSESVDKTGFKSAKFTVISIDGKPLEHNYKARTQEIPLSYLKSCAEAFITGDTLIIRGDISKSKGKIAKIVVGNLNRKEPPKDLFSFVDKENK